MCAGGGSAHDRSMGFMKQMKDMRQVVAAAPGLINQANALGAQAAQLQAMQAGTTIAPGDPRLAPIAGVTLERYAEVAKAIQNAQARTTEAMAAVVAAKGLSQEVWDAAYEGWNARMKGDMQLATQFGHLFQASAG